MRNSEVLEKMLEILSHEGRWKAGNLAVDRSFAPVGPLSPTARKWSVEGACLKAGGDFAKIKGYLLAFKPRLGADGESVTHIALMQLLHGALKLAQLDELFNK